MYKWYQSAQTALLNTIEWIIKLESAVYMTFLIYRSLVSVDGMLKNIKCSIMKYDVKYLLTDVLIFE